MTRKPFYFIMLSGLVLFVALTFLVKKPDTGAPGGEAIQFDAEGAYASSCASCHGADLTGTAGPSLVGLTLSSGEIIDIIDNGLPGGMPPGMFKGSKAQKEALANWILEHQ